jgi:hypothetical protein
VDRICHLHRFLPVCSGLCLFRQAPEILCSAPVSVTANRSQPAPRVSIVSIPHAGRLEGASDRPEFEAIRLKTAPVATHCKSATYRSVTWKHTGTSSSSRRRIRVIILECAGCFRQSATTCRPSHASSLHAIRTRYGKFVKVPTDQSPTSRAASGSRPRSCPFTPPPENRGGCLSLARALLNERRSLFEGRRKVPLHQKGVGEGFSFPAAQDTHFAGSPVENNLRDRPLARVRWGGRLPPWKSGVATTSCWLVRYGLGSMIPDDGS